MPNHRMKSGIRELSQIREIVVLDAAGKWAESSLPTLPEIDSLALPAAEESVLRLGI